MPYAMRRPDGTLLSLHREPEPGAEFLPSDHPEVVGFLGGVDPGGFAKLDADLIRVIEDLVDTLISRQVIRLTDLPVEAQDKLFARKSFRERRVAESLNLYSGSEGDDVVRADTDWSEAIDLDADVPDRSPGNPLGPLTR
jgi:hypothetical protein